MMYEIEKGVPMDEAGTRGRTPKYPFAKMEVGDSFLADGEAAVAHRCKAYNAAQQHGRAYGKKFSGRQEPGRPGYVRIWRIE